jgi:signal transduction histidine kinase
MRTLPIFGEVIDGIMEAGHPLPTFQIFHIVYFTHGYLMFITYEAVPNDWDVFKRFGKVFQQIYTRFLDLQKAEAQTRTAQINLAVERVRAKALAMHKSEEIMSLVTKLKDEVMALDIPDVIAATILLNEGEDKVRMWDLSTLEKDNNGYQIPFDITFKLKKKDPNLYVKRVWENDENYFIEVQDAKDLKRIVAWLRENNKNEIANEVEAYTKNSKLERLHHAVKKLNNGKLVIDLLNPPSDEMEPILTKMGAAFDLAYTRFLDLKKAEAQTREAQIEAALEKVRSCSLAMHNPEELQEVVAVVAKKLKELGVIYDAGGVILCTYFPDNKDVIHWISVDDFSSSGRYFVPYFDNPIFNEAWDSKMKGDAYFSRAFPVAVKNDFFKQAFANSDYRQMPEDYKQFVLQADSHNLSAAWSKNSAILIPSLNGTVPSESDANILTRFAKVFEQAYIRFLDLKKAQAQAREAQIEMALEKVRSRSLAMQKSDELLDVIGIVSEQVHALGLKFDTICFGESNKEGAVKFWLTSKGLPKPILIDVPPIKNKAVHRVVKAQKDGLKFLADVVTGNTYTKWNNHMLTHSQLQYLPEAAKTYLTKTSGFARSSFFLKEIALYVMNYKIEPFSDADNAIFNRFAQVFDQSYTRFLDLQTAEKNAYKNKVEAALERVRSRAMAMQEPEELKDVAQILRTEMGLLGFEELETCSIYILDKKVATAECWYAIKNSDKNRELVADHISMDFTATWVGKQMLEFHDSKAETRSIVMKGDKRKEWITYCMAQSKVLKDVYSDTIPDRTYHLQKFSHGAIGAASAGDISAESWALLKRSASVFSLAYARFKDLTQARIDLKQLKKAKKRAEEALSELQQTQTQLIQSEKMASLGELTAGIAHEIQNPLNFVNNFSEVSKELLEEMQEEIENGDFEEVKAIMEDVIQNLEKINHHGKRADGIVKGMLQHSRSSTGTKEPTDINALADEYLRLAYHGLRAKDKSFNATLETDFDDSIGTINVLPQDIGRVILNLITNAFYVSNERKLASNDPSFKPTVTVATKKLNNRVQISVMDNGNGIPKEIVDKIFQPFFTTKPTGQGTGLGLSMSYDIVTKGHGGALKVKTKVGEGTTFIIELPNTI